MVKLLSLHQIRNYEDSNASNISDLSKIFIRGSKLINNDYLRSAYDSNNSNCNILWETITWKERYFHIRSMRGHPNEPRILMVPHRVLAVVLPRYPAQKVPEILLKSFTYKWPLLYILKGILYVDRILLLPFRAVLFFLNSIWTFTRPQTRKFVVLRAYLRTILAFWLLKLEYADLLYPGSNTRCFILDFDDKPWSTVVNRGWPQPSKLDLPIQIQNNRSGTFQKTHFNLDIFLRSHNRCINTTNYYNTIIINLQTIIYATE